MLALFIIPSTNFALMHCYTNSELSLMHFMYGASEGTRTSSQRMYLQKFVGRQIWLTFEIFHFELLVRGSFYASSVIWAVEDCHKIRVVEEVALRTVDDNTTISTRCVGFQQLEDFKWRIAPVPFKESTSSEIFQNTFEYRAIRKLPRTLCTLLKVRPFQFAAPYKNIRAPNSCNNAFSLKFLRGMMTKYNKLFSPFHLNLTFPYPHSCTKPSYSDPLYVPVYFCQIFWNTLYSLFPIRLDYHFFLLSRIFLLFIRRRASAIHFSGMCYSQKSPTFPRRILLILF